MVWVFVVAATAGGQSAEPAGGEQGMYRARLEGFALRPPAGAQKTEQRIPGVLAEWTRQDPKTAQTLWTLRVYRTTFRNHEANIRDYAQAVKERLSLRPGATIDAMDFGDVAGCPAMYLAGRVAGQVRTDATGMESKLPPTHFRQAWFLRGPGEFLVLDFVRTEDSPDRLETTWKGLISSVELFDAEEFLREQREHIRRGGVFLKALRPEAVQKILPRKPRWFLVRQDGKLIGWLCRQGRSARRDKVAGYEICSWAMYQPPSQPPRLLRQQEFTDPKMSMDIWNGRVQLGSGEQAALLAEDGLRQGRVILTTFHDGRRQVNETKTMPEAVIGMYLPRLVGALLPSLLDRTKPAAYTFAEYDRRVNDFQMRTVAVVGPDRVEQKGKLVPAVKITDQPTADAEPVTFWVDAAGRVLQSRSPDGWVSSSASEEEVLSVYPNARSIITQMNQTQPPPRDASHRPAARK